MWLFFSLAFAAPPEALVDAVSARHMDADCAELLDRHGVDALVAVADEVAMPPWAPMRAARCVGEAADRGGDVAIRRWLEDPAVPGLAIAAVTGLEVVKSVTGLEDAVSARMSDERFARAVHLDRSVHPTLRALVVDAE